MDTCEDSENSERGKEADTGTYGISTSGDTEVGSVRTLRVLRVETTAKSGRSTNAYTGMESAR